MGGGQGQLAVGSWQEQEQEQEQEANIKLASFGALNDILPTAPASCLLLLPLLLPLPRYGAEIVPSAATFTAVGPKSSCESCLMTFVAAPFLSTRGPLCPCWTSG